MPVSRTASGAPRLIVNADDFGLHPAINQAVIAGHRDGIITSCSLLAFAGEPSFAEAVALSHETPTLDVGLHFALVGLPGLPPGYRDFVASRLTGCFPDSRIETLLNRQIDLLEAQGIHPSHIDSHQHLHALPSIMRIVCRVARQRGIAAVRLPRETGRLDAPAGRRLASRALSAVAGRAAREIELGGLWRPDHFLGMAVSGHLDEAHLLALIDQVPETGVTEVLCHPGSDNRVLGAVYDWGYDWEGECAAVCSAAVREALVKRRIELTTFAKAPYSV
jgi:predicted glycoside hydrolase/deacetylase ChbG (UPF0249 family)